MRLEPAAEQPFTAQAREEAREKINKIFIYNNIMEVNIQIIIAFIVGLVLLVLIDKN